MCLLLLLAAVAVDVWSVQTYGLRVEPELPRFFVVALLAHLPVVVVTLRAATGSGGPSVAGLARALLPSLLAVAGCGWLVVTTGPTTTPWSVVTDAVAATVFGWLVIGGVTIVLRRPRPPKPRPGLPHLVRVLRVVAGVVLVGIGVAMPATTRGLLEQDRLGMTDQVQALLTGYGDPVATRLVASYAAVFGVLLLLDLLLRRRSADAAGRAGQSQSRSVMPSECGALSRKP